MKKLLSLFLTVTLTLALTLSLTACGKGKKIIGIMQFGTHESLNNCYEGILKGLKEQDITDKDYEFVYLNDNFDPTTSASHASSLKNQGASVIIGIATPSAIAAADAVDGEIPVVFCAVTDGSIFKTNYTNVCGSSDMPNYEKTLELVTATMGKQNLKIGVISHTSESSDAVMIDSLKESAKAYDGMEINVKYISEISTISTTVNTLISEGVDCLLNLLDNTVVGQLETILDITNANNIPVFGSEVEQAVSGCVAASSIDYIEIGRISGEMAGKILKGTDTASKLGTQIISNPTPYYNPTVITAFGLTAPNLEGIISTANYNK